MSQIPGNMAGTLKELADQLNNAHHLLANSIQQDDGPRLAAVGALEIVLEVSAELKLAIEQVRSYLASFHSATTIAEIQSRVAGHFGIPLIEMKSACRARCIARPRQVAMYLSKELTSHSLAAIGHQFGRRDHTTVIYAVNQIKKLAESQPELGSAVADIRLELAPK